MIINCPKCGFAQPKDKYCASCGIDMETYRPARQPWHVRLAKNWMLQLALLIGAVAVAGGYIRFQNHKALQERIAEYEEAHTMETVERRLENPLDESEHASASVGSTEERAAAPAPAAEPAHEGASPSFAGAPQAQETGTAQAMAAAPAAGAPSSASSPNHYLSAPMKPAADKTAPKLHVSFAEVRTAYMSELMNETRAVASEGALRMGLVQDLGPRLKSAVQSGAAKSLDSGESVNLRLNQPVMLFKGARDDNGQNLGLTLQITPTAMDDNGAQLQIEVSRTLRDPASAGPVTFQEQVVIPRESGVFVAGALPRKPVVDDEEARFYQSAGILKVFNSPAFQNNTSEFIIFIENR